MLAPHQPERAQALRQAAVTLIAGFLLGALLVSFGKERAECRLPYGEDALALRRRRQDALPPPQMPPRVPVAESCPSQLQHCVAPSVPEAPSLASYKKLKKSPQAAVKNASLLAEFEAAPWLLPTRTPALPYAGIHDFDKLLKLRAMRAGGYDKAITILLFSKDWAVMAQNSIYSLVKHGGACNYLAVTWTPRDVEACQDLNLPCADVSDLLVKPISGKKPTPADFVVMSWIKPAVLLTALQQGYVVMLADTDISYTAKPLWQSYMMFIEQAEADGAWLEEKPASNTGHFVVLPTDAGVAFARAWSGLAPSMIKEGQTDQRALPRLELQAFIRCNTPCRCLRTSFNLTDHGQRDSMALFRTYLPGHYVYSQNWCTIGSAQWVPRIDPCDWHVLYLHPICISQPDIKEDVLRAAGFWFIDNEQGCEEQPGAASKVPSCRPLSWRHPDAEAAHYRCASYGPGLVHGGESAAMQAVREGVAVYNERAAVKLFELDGVGKFC